MSFVSATVIAFGVTLFLSACAAPKEPRLLSELPPADIIKALGLHNSTWAYHAIDVETGRVIASQFANETQPPASTAKLPTMIAALGILGADHQFETSLMTNGKIVGTTIVGDLVLRGTGDPLLRPNDLRDLATKLHDAGIRQISGKFLYHSTLPTFPVVEENQPETAPYNQGVGGLNVDFNRARLTRRWSTAGQINHYFTPTEASGLTPPIDLFPKRTMIDVPIQKPGLLVARSFKKLAAIEGVALPNPSIAIGGGSMSTLASVKSPALKHIVRVGLEYSNNMVAEAVGLAAASALGSTPDSLSTSSKHLTRWLDKNVVTESRFAPFLANHSGLSAASRITPEEMTNLLRHTWAIRHQGQRFDHLLPPAGGREGYRGRFRDPETAYRVWGKTGSMHYIKGLAGYIDTRIGNRLAFAIFTNDLKRRIQLSHAQNMDSDVIRAEAHAWRTKAEAFESELIRRWISKL